MAALTIGFDVYGTLVDPLEMHRHLEPLVGAKAPVFAQLWREKQLEYTWRKSLMQRYEDFSACTRQALVFAMHSVETPLTYAQQEQLLDAYQSLSPYPDVIVGLIALREVGHRLFAFSNGTAEMVSALLRANGVLNHLHGVISVDEVGVYKPAPEAYWHLAERTEATPDDTWLVSSNAFDVIGAKCAGIHAAWLKRDPKRVFAPWGIEPDAVVSGLPQLSSVLPQ